MDQKPTRHQTHHARYALHMPSKRFRYVLISLAVAIAGLLLLQGLRAASYVLDSQAESGTTAGNAIESTVNGASGGQAVTFGGSTMAPPTNLKVHTGGDNIALTWRMPRGIPFKAVEVYRNDTKVATVTPNTGVVRAEREAIRYIDRAVTRGTTYQYKVRAISPTDTPSAYTSAVSGRHPTGGTPIPTVTIDSTQAPDLNNYVSTSLKSEVEIWYPKISDAIAYPDYTPNSKVHILLDPANTGVANANQQRISINPAWLRNNALDGGGMIIHEATHVMQNYPGGVPGWVTEGIADWTRDWFMQERFHIPAPDAVLSNGYAEGAIALQWGEVKYSPGLIRKVNVAANKGAYNANLIPSLTGGRSGEQLYAEVKQQHFGSTGAIQGIGGACIDIPNSDPTFGVKPQLFGCNNSNAQRWTVRYEDAGLHGTAKSILSFVNTAIIANGRCLDVVSSGTANNTPVHSWHCNYGNPQRWVRGPNNSLVNPTSGKCLSTAGQSAAIGSQLVINPCDGNASQRWTTPN